MEISNIHEEARIKLMFLKITRVNLKIDILANYTKTLSDLIFIFDYSAQFSKLEYEFYESFFR